MRFNIKKFGQNVSSGYNENLKGYLIYPELFYLPFSELASYIGVNGANQNSWDSNWERNYFWTILIKATGKKPSTVSSHHSRWNMKS